jgi:malonyl-CoA/methylmalonyl-CoA synthetase
MTEFAMALSNPLTPTEKRLPGFVGMPLPSVEVKIIDEDTSETISSFDRINGQISKATSEGASQSGELCVRGPTVFSEYWRKPHATVESFDFEGYFKTGDVAEYDPNHESYHILGRVSADIIKCGGHKLSSLQIERVLLEHPDIEELVVLGVPDLTYGERVGMICRLKPDVDGLTLKELQNWARPRLAGYKIPTLMIVMKGDIPKNAMQKVSKKQLVHLFEGGDVQK